MGLFSCLKAAGIDLGKLIKPEPEPEPSRADFFRRAQNDVFFIVGMFMQQRGIEATSAFAAVHEAVPVGHEYVLFHFYGLAQVTADAAALLGVEPPSLVSGTVH